MIKYYVYCYSRTGRFVKCYDSITFERAVRIRKEWVECNDITDFGYMPTIWKYEYGTDKFERVLGY